MCFGVFWVGWSWAAVITALVLYLIRMFAITGFYHRYFSHKSFKTNRFWQFIFAILGNSAVQRGPLWWAAHHRHHHRFADQTDDVHSPLQHGFWWSHIGWLTTPQNFVTKKRYVGDWLKVPELRWLNRFNILVPIALAVGLFGFGMLLEEYIPQWKTNGFQMLIWGFFISSTVLFHATATINSIDHLLGSRRYDTPDTSRNNFWLSLLTLGEGWHNNHHHYAVSARQGFFWWELDITYYGLVLLSWLGIIWDIQPIPDHIKETNFIREKGG
jgi:stearoyl-CoA desaturase (delta-9 desaturase)